MSRNPVGVDELARRGEFAYATVTDQYTLQHFEQNRTRRTRTRDGRDRPHLQPHPYTPLPKFIDWHDIGGGTVYKPMPKLCPQPSEMRPDPTRVRDAYTKSIAYSLTSVISYVETYGDDDLVLVFLSDHQPQPIIASQDSTRDVPITIVSRDPAVLGRISTWGWQPGLNPKAPRLADEHLPRQVPHRPRTSDTDREIRLTRITRRR